MPDLDKTQTVEDTTLKPADGTPKAKEPSPGQAEPSPEQEPKTLTITEAEKLAQLARMDAGRAQKTAEDARDASQTALATKDVELADIAEERDKLKTDIDDLSSNDPAKFNIVKKDRDLVLRENKLKTDIRTEEAKWKTNEERVKKSEDHLREIFINEIAANYEGGDAAKLVTLCETFGANTDEEITKVASTLWAKKTTEPQKSETPTLKPFSGKTSGGSEDDSDLSPREKIQKGIDKLK